MNNFLHVSGGSADVLFGIKIFGKHNRKPWFRKTVWPAYRFARRIHNGRQWFRYRLSSRLRARWVGTGLKPGWYDADTIILHAAMNALGLYIEESGGVDVLEEWTQQLRQPGSEGHGPRESVDYQAARQSEALEIWHWWTVEKPAEEKRRDELLHTLYGNKERVTFKPAENNLSEMIFKPFEGDEQALYAEFRDLEKKMEDDEQKMLHRLIDIRRSLWT